MINGEVADEDAVAAVVAAAADAVDADSRSTLERMAAAHRGSPMKARHTSAAGAAAAVAAAGTNGAYCNTPSSVSSSCKIRQWDHRQLVPSPCSSKIKWILGLRQDQTKPIHLTRSRLKAPLNDLESLSHGWSLSSGRTYTSEEA